MANNCVSPSWHAWVWFTLNGGLLNGWRHWQYAAPVPCTPTPITTSPHRWLHCTASNQPAGSDNVPRLCTHRVHCIPCRCHPTGTCLPLSRSAHPDVRVGSCNRRTNTHRTRSTVVLASSRAVSLWSVRSTWLLVWCSLRRCSRSRNGTRSVYRGGACPGCHHRRHRSSALCGTRHGQSTPVWSWWMDNGARAWSCSHHHHGSTQRCCIAGARRKVRRGASTTWASDEAHTSSHTPCPTSMTSGHPVARHAAASLFRDTRSVLKARLLAILWQAGAVNSTAHIRVGTHTPHATRTCRGWLLKESRP